jgi:hypothetical protein
VPLPSQAPHSCAIVCESPWEKVWDKAAYITHQNDSQYQSGEDRSTPLTSLSSHPSAKQGLRDETIFISVGLKVIRNILTSTEERVAELSDFIANSFFPFLPTHRTESIIICRCDY